jgi:hypothetical protein
MSDIPKLNHAHISATLGWLGRGFDVFGSFDLDNSAKDELFDSEKVKSHEEKFGSQYYIIPSYISLASDPDTNSKIKVFQSREAMQRHLAVEAGLQVSYRGLFSGQFSAAYQKDVSVTQEYNYAYTKQFTRFGIATMDGEYKYLKNSVQERINQLPDQFSQENAHVFFQFFEKYGAFYIKKIILGGSATVYVSIAKSTSDTKEDIKASLKASYNGFFVKGSVSADVKHSSSYQNYQKNSEANMITYGGDSAKATTFMGLAQNYYFSPQPDNGTVEAFKAWEASISESPAITHFDVEGIWNLCGAKSSAVKAAWHAWYSQRRPKLTMTSVCSHNNTARPTITIDNMDLTPSQGSEHNCGIQAIILDPSKDITKPEAVRLNQFFSYYPFPMGQDSSSSDFWHMFEELSHSLSNTLQPNDIVILCSYNIQGIGSGEGSLFAEVLDKLGIAKERVIYNGTRGVNEEIPILDNIAVSGSLNYMDKAAQFMLVGQYQETPEAGSAVAYYWDVMGLPDGEPVEAKMSVLFYTSDVKGGNYSIGDGEILKEPDTGFIWLEGDTLPGKN